MSSCYFRLRPRGGQAPEQERASAVHDFHVARQFDRIPVPFGEAVEAPIDAAQAGIVDARVSP